MWQTKTDRSGLRLRLLTVYSMVGCIPVVSGQFFSGWMAFQSGTAPANQNKITVTQPGGSDNGHELVVVCPN